jgi:hypothetical protein
MYRVDASFTDEEWRTIFRNIHTAGISNVIFIPSSFLSILSIFNRKWREIRWFVTGKRIAFSGYLRTQHTFKSYWKGLYAEKSYEFGGIKGFLLEIK